MSTIRKPAVAGKFYPDNSRVLRAALHDYLSRADHHDASPKAIIVPHAGYVYSGPVAASGYAVLDSLRETISRVVLLGPVHHVPVRGLAATSAAAFETPLGQIPIDVDAVEQLLNLPQVEIRDEAHAPEHSLEVHLPFLQEVIDDFTLVPLVVGGASFEEVSEVIERLWGRSETLFVISTDLSHYHDYETARQIDAETSKAIIEMRIEDLRGERACGFKAVGGMLHAARKHGLQVQALDVRNSGDTAGPRDRVVGYGAYLIASDESTATLQSDTAATESIVHMQNEPTMTATTTTEEPAGPLTDEERRTLIDVAQKSIERGVSVGQGLQVDPVEYSPALQATKSSFVTLKIDGQLRGCMGSLVARESLVVDVARHAFSAGFLDPRFPPLGLFELDRLQVSISILEPPEILPFTSEADLLERIRPGIDGLILSEGKQRGTLLPSVWEGVSGPQEFLQHLKKKAGLPADYWSPTIQMHRYVTTSIGDE
jgi:hypothetical protein